MEMLPERYKHIYLETATADWLNCITDTARFQADTIEAWRTATSPVDNIATRFSDINPDDRAIIAAPESKDARH